MKRIFILVLSILMIFVLSSCKMLTTTSENTKLKVCGYISIKGMGSPDLKGSYFTDVIDRDSYGRILFEYIAGEEKAYLVAQCLDEYSIGYYKRKNYTFKNDEESIEFLKEQNDWEKPLDKTKIVYQEYKVSFDQMVTLKDEIRCDEFGNITRNTFFW